jgi:hypothetical protein
MMAGLKKIKIDRGIVVATAVAVFLAAWLIALAVRHLHLYPQV